MAVILLGMLVKKREGWTLHLGDAKSKLNECPNQLLINKTWVLRMFVYCFKGNVYTVNTKIKQVNIKYIFVCLGLGTFGFWRCESCGWGKWNIEPRFSGKIHIVIPF